MWYLLGALICIWILYLTNIFRNIARFLRILNIQIALNPIKVTSIKLRFINFFFSIHASSLMQTIFQQYMQWSNNALLQRNRKYRHWNARKDIYVYINFSFPMDDISVILTNVAHERMVTISLLLCIYLIETSN